ncbi:MAG: hypothetical protein ACREVC_05845 [Burkholderiales bacterium]
MVDALRAIGGRRKGWLCALAALVPLSCASLEEGSLEGIKVTNLPVVSFPLAWMDNERILLRVDTGKRIDARGGGQYAVFNLISYNYKTGERHDYGRVGSQICYADGYISHARRDDDNDKEVVVVYGELGNETTRKVKPGDIWFEGGARGSCRPWSEHPKRPVWAKGNSEILTLWPRLGVIDCRTRGASVITKPIKARFHKPNDNIGVELPFSCYEVIGGLRYYPFKSAYFAFEWDYHSPWPEGRDRRAFWLYPDGHVETLTFHYSKAIRHTAIPVVDGILAFSRADSREDDYWVYLLTPQSTKRLYRGDATGITSPDGCKVAMLIDPDFKAKIWSRDVKMPVSLKVFDFCRKI